MLKDNQIRKSLSGNEAVSIAMRQIRLISALSNNSSQEVPVFSTL